MDRGLLATDHLHHQLKECGKQQGARVLPLGDGLEPGIQLRRVQAALQHRPGHGGDREMLGKALQDRVEQRGHEGASERKALNLSEVGSTFKALVIYTYLTKRAQ